MRKPIIFRGSLRNRAATNGIRSEESSVRRRRENAAEVSMQIKSEKIFAADAFSNPILAQTEKESEKAEKPSAKNYRNYYKKDTEIMNESKNCRDFAETQAEKDANGETAETADEKEVFLENENGNEPNGAAVSPKNGSDMPEDDKPRVELSELTKVGEDLKDLCDDLLNSASD